MSLLHMAVARELASTLPDLIAGQGWEEGERRVSAAAVAHVLLLLADYAHRETNEAWPSIESISDDCCRDRRTVQDVLRKLERLGLVESAPRSDAPGGSRPTVYTVLADYVPEQQATESEKTRLRRQLKRRLYGDQDGRCNGCGELFGIEVMELDHVVAKARGGSDKASNRQLLCGPCNRLKGTRSHDWLLDQLAARDQGGETPHPERDQGGEVSGTSAVSRHDQSGVSPPDPIRRSDPEIRSDPEREISPPTPPRLQVVDSAETEPGDEDEAAAELAVLDGDVLDVYRLLASSLSIFTPPEGWAEAWLERVTFDDIIEAIGKGREKRARTTRYIDAILEGVARDSTPEPEPEHEEVVL